MALNVGDRLGHYDVTALIGEGGMGQVYQATDTKLNRQVALKILPEAFSADPDRLARFRREAQVLASLNHPGIAAIYGIEEADDTRALVLELVEGPTLADRIAKGRVPVEEALSIAKQIAEALEAAHETGVIHRDLKPANIKVRDDGTVKVLDFGLAKAAAGDASGADLSHSPTLTIGTQQGVILGTAAYMSPEQARAKPLDRRTDIWAFGCVLYEMLTGHAAFLEDTLSDTTAKILDREPDWKALPLMTPSSLKRLLRRCLNKDSKDRLRDIGDARVELREVLSAEEVSSSGPRPPAARPRPFRIAAAVVVTGVAAGLTAWMLSPTSTVSRSADAFAVMLPPDVELWRSLRGDEGAMVMSPDGSSLVYVGARGGNTQLYHRRMTEVDAVPIPGTTGAVGPFFSPDGQWVGFRLINPDSYRKVSLVDGTVLTICAFPDESRVGIGGGASWGDDDMIWIGGLRTGLYRVSAGGGEPRLVSTPDSDDGVVGHLTPQVLPGNRAVLYTAFRGPTTSDTVALYSLDTGEHFTLAVGSRPQFAASGHVIYSGSDASSGGRFPSGALWALPFDVRRLEATGEPFLVQDGFRVVPGSETGAVLAVLSADGTLVSVPAVAGADERTLVWVDRTGDEEAIAIEPGPYREPRLSPDGTRLVVETATAAGSDLSVYHLAQGNLMRLTLAAGVDQYPLWTPDSQRLLFSSNRAGETELYWMPADGTGQAELLLAGGERRSAAWDWALGSNTLLLSEFTSGPTQYDIGQLGMVGDRQRAPVLEELYNEYMPAVSPDGRWMAYGSSEGAGPGLYVRSYPDVTEVKVGPIGAGSQIRWSPDGTELFYRDGVALMSVSVTTEPSLSLGPPEPLFDDVYFYRFGYQDYDIAADGRFVMVKGDRPTVDTEQVRQIIVQRDWSQSLTTRGQ